MYYARPIYELPRSRIGGFSGAIVGELTLATAVFGLPAVFMGSTFSYNLIQRLDIPT